MDWARTWGGGQLRLRQLRKRKGRGVRRRSRGDIPAPYILHEECWRADIEGWGWQRSLISGRTTVGSDQGYVNESPHSTEEPSEAANHKMCRQNSPLPSSSPSPATILKGLQIPGTIEVRRNRFPIQTTNYCSFWLCNTPNWDWKEASILSCKWVFGLLLGWTLSLLKSDQRGPERSCNLSKFYPVQSKLKTYTE